MVDARHICICVCIVIDEHARDSCVRAQLQYLYFKMARMTINMQGRSTPTWKAEIVLRLNEMISMYMCLGGGNANM